MSTSICQDRRVPNQPWTRIDASSDWSLAGEEQQGLDQHPWLRRDPHQRLWLFKQTSPESDHELTDDLVEKMASEIAQAVGVPAARVELVTRNGVNGCLVESLKPSKWSFYAGQVPLSDVVSDYDPKDREHTGYTVRAVREALDGFDSPPDHPATASLTAFEVFTGYLLFDALIGNTDRHDRNWAVLVPPPGDARSDALCGSYDHASSLAFNSSNSQRRRVLTEQSMVQFVRKAKARQFEFVSGSPRRGLLDIAAEALDLCPPQVGEHWRDTFSSVGRGVLEEIVGKAPGLSDLTREFTVELLVTNRRRILNART